MSKSNSTYSTMSKWLKWSSLLILLIPITIFGLGIANYLEKLSESTFYDVCRVLDIVLLVLSAIWIILNVLLFFAAGTVKHKTSPLSIRIGLLISFALVLSPIIISLLIYYEVITGEEKAVNLVIILLPLLIAFGYLVAFFCAQKTQYKTA